MTPWPGLLRLAALRFGIAPDAFWRLSLVEWRALVDEPSGALNRAALETLARAWPDG